MDKGGDRGLGRKEEQTLREQTEDSENQGVLAHLMETDRPHLEGGGQGGPGVRNRERSSASLEEDRGLRRHQRVAGARPWAGSDQGFGFGFIYISIYLFFFLDNVWFIHSMEYYIAMNTNQVHVHAAKVLHTIEQISQYKRIRTVFDSIHIMSQNRQH